MRHDQRNRREDALPTPWYFFASPRIVLFAAVLFLLGLLIGFSAFSGTKDDMLAAVGTGPVREIGDYRFINPLLECEVADGAIDAPKSNFRRALEEKVAAITQEGRGTVAVYYRDLNNGPAFGVNENEKFIPASLLKVPVMIAYFAAAGKEPDLLDRELWYGAVFPSPEPGVQYIAPHETLIPGSRYRVRELIRRMIVHSDNQSLMLLFEHLPAKELREAYRVLGVDDGVLNGADGRLTVREYATFFRILFNASYLDRAASERALKLLAQTEFANGIVAGVPEGTVVAHKFGEGGNEDEPQIHDCGVVYAPGRPYLLCVMTRGTDQHALKTTVAEVSRFVYDSVTVAQ